MPTINEELNRLERMMPKETKYDPGMIRMDICYEMQRAEFGFNDIETLAVVKERLIKKYGMKKFTKILSSLDELATQQTGGFEASISRYQEAEALYKSKRVNQR